MLQNIAAFRLKKAGGMRNDGLDHTADVCDVWYNRLLVHGTGRQIHRPPYGQQQHTGAGDEGE